MPMKRSGSRATGRVTLHDVAAVAQVSPITASRALRGQPSVAAELVARVQAAASKLGYVPDPAARALASARSTTVAVLVPALAHGGFAELLAAIHRGLWPAGLQALIGVTHEDAAEEERLLRRYLLHRPAGLILCGPPRSDASRGLIAVSGAPWVQVLELADAAGPPSVGVSHEALGHAVTRHLLERGRRRIAFVAARSGTREASLAEGWRRALHEANLYDARREVIDARDASIALGAELFEQLHERQRATDAVFFAGDALAQGALLAALRLHVRVPQQIAVAGCDDLAGSELMPPALTSVRLPWAAIGEEAAGLLLGLMRGEEPPQRRLDLGFELLPRGSS
jgi:LacI family gluconate utilization system Gnt-I transcriptional repressor